MSSLWLLSSNTGSYLGSVAGAALYDRVGFQSGSLVEAMVINGAVNIMVVMALRRELLLR